MKREQLMDVFVLTKRIGNLLNEVMDISRQLSEAVDRQDEVSIEMIVAMRSDPIDKLIIADRALREHIQALGDGEDSIRFRAMLNGDASVAQDETENALVAQATANMRLHRRLLELDEILSKKIGREKSIYR